MTPEGKVKKDFISFLREQGCVVRINKQDSTTQKGYPDISWWADGICGVAEIKAHYNSSFRPGQKEWLDRFSKFTNTSVEIVCAENLEEVCDRIKSLIERHKK